MPVPKPAPGLSGVLIVLDDTLYKGDLDLLDRYLSFSAEIVRLSLAGFAGAGLAVSWFLKDGKLQLASAPKPFVGAIVFGLVFLALATALALAHRYVASGGIYHHLRAIKHLVLLKEHEWDEGTANSIRATVTADEQYRNTQIRMSACILLVAAGCLTFAVFSALFGIVVLLTA
ncbi:hypothetical protein MKK50_14280 [Methylobacterium sp. J-043]|nr:hypothetical protein [Methylobacterium sp. J-043]